MLVRLIGRGAVGSVYEAFDTSRQRDVAVKVLADDKAREAECVGRLMAEARALARVNHPNTVAVLDVCHRANVCYLAMELMTGGSLQDELDRAGAVDWPVATRMLLDGCRALAATHDAGLVHRDVKPSNLMRDASGRVKLTDFGLATLTGMAGATGGGPAAANVVVGTPQFMSPEQCRGEPVDARGDLYSLGATYYALLTGEPPYRGTGPVQIMFAQCASPVRDPRDVNAEVPGCCAAIVRRATAKRASERYGSADDMAADLARCLTSARASRTAARG